MPDNTYPDGYVRPTTQEEYRQALIWLTQGKFWCQLCTDKHIVAWLVTQAIAELHPEN
jgi:hypothetical protein